MEQPRAVLDACVLYPAPLRDFLMECAVTEFYQPYWTDAIQSEWITNLRAKRPDLSLDRLNRTRDLMQRAIPQALITGYESLIETLTLPDLGDRHVLAAALHSGVPVILTFNFRDFPTRVLRPYGITAEHPDHFLVQIAERQKDQFLTMIRLHRVRLQNPPKDAAEYIATLRQNQLKQIADLLDQHQDEI